MDALLDLSLDLPKPRADQAISKGREGGQVIAELFEDPEGLT
jgi:hypothetical protein